MLNPVDGGDFGWAAEQARRALEAAQAQRQAELERARTLAASALPGLDPQNPEGPNLLGKVLARVQGLVPEARVAFASDLAGGVPAPLVSSPTPRDPASAVETLVNQSCPPGSDRRTQMGQALLASVGVSVGGLQERVLETAIKQALAGLRPVGALKPKPTAPTQDVLERAPRPIGAGWDRGAGGPSGTAQAAPMERLSSTSQVAIATPGAVSIGPAERAAPDLQAPAAVLRAHQARVDHGSDVASDVKALSAALGGLTPPATVPAAAEGVFLGVERVAWTEAAPDLIAAPLHAVASRLETLAGKAERVRATLIEGESGTLKQQLALVGTASLMEKVAFHAATARALVHPVRGPRESLHAIAAARGEVGQARAYTGEALARLGELRGHYRGLTPTVTEVREVERLARQSEAELRTIGARTAMLEAVDAGAGALSVEPKAEAAAGPGLLTEDDLARIGSGLDPTKPPPQITWSEELVNTTCELGRQQGGVTDADGARHLELARMALGGDGAAASGGPRPLEAPDLAAVLKMAGVALEKVDPSQLVSAAAYVSSATSLADQQEKLRKALDSFQTLSTIGAPRLSRQQMVDQLWAMAKVPGHALQKLSDAEVQRKYQEVAGALNAGPGASQIKIGSHDLKLQVGEAGQVLSTSCKKPSFLSQAWGVIKKVAPIALTAASFVFTGGTATALIRLGQGLLSAVDAIKSGSVLAIVTAGASIVGAGSSLFKGGAGMAGRVATVATNATRALQGVSRMRQGDFLGGLASIGQGIAGGIGSFAGAANKGLLDMGERLAYYSTKLSAVGTGVSAFRGFTSANRAVDEARRMLAAARASGDPRQVAEAEKQLKQAESQKRTSIFGAAAGALDAASLWVGDRARWDGAPVLEFGGPGLSSRLQLAGQGLRVARDVSAGDYLGAAVSGLGMGANIDAARHGGASSALTDVARMAEAGLDYHRSRQALSDAEEAVEFAEARLAAARTMGDPELVREAELALSQARRGHESAATGSIAAGESLIGTAQGVAADRRIRSAETHQRQKVVTECLLQSGVADEAILRALAQDRSLPAGLRAQAEATLDELKAARVALQQTVLAAGEDTRRIADATREYELAIKQARASEDEIQTLALADLRLRGASGPLVASVGIRDVGEHTGARPREVTATLFESDSLPDNHLFEEVYGYDASSGKVLLVRPDRQGNDTIVEKEPSPLLRNLIDEHGGTQGAIEHLRNLRDSGISRYSTITTSPGDYFDGKLDEDLVFDRFIEQVGSWALEVPGLRDVFVSRIGSMSPGETRDVSLPYSVAYDYSAGRAFDLAEQTSSSLPFVHGWQTQGSLIGQSLEGFAPKDFALEQSLWLAADAALTASAGVSLYRLTAGLVRPKPEGVWLLGDRERGLLLEDRLGGNLPPGFKTFDRFQPDIWFDPRTGRATSVKSMNLFDRYGDASDLFSTGKQYVNRILDFDDFTRMRVRLDEGMITSRRLDIVIPKGAANRQQVEALLKLRAYGLDNNVVVRIIEVAK